VNRIVWNTAGTVGGTAVGGAVGTLVGPEGTVIGGAFGGSLGGDFGKWVAKKTDGLARDAGEKVGIGIAKGLDYVDKLKKSISSFDFNLKVNMLPWN
jgi:hypothetical protein